MKKSLIAVLAALFSITGFAQEKVYDESIDAMDQLQKAIKTAQSTDRYVLAQVGGNWCPWCLRFAEMAKTDSLVKAAIDKDFVYIHVNYSKANKNEKAMEFLKNPARFGFPVFVIINNKGEVIHIQDSSYLEEGKGYSTEKVLKFLSLWTKSAVETPAKRK